MISVTLLSQYLFCPRKIYNQYILGIKPKENLPMVKGLIRHNVLDQANRREKILITKFSPTKTLEQLKQEYKTQYNNILQEKIKENSTKLIKLDSSPLQIYQELFPDIKEEAKEKAIQLFNFAKLHNAYEERLWNALPKPITELRVQSDTLQIRGIIDRVEKYNNEFIPIEIKTGKAPTEGIWKNHKIQLAAYILLLSEHYGTTITEGFLDYSGSRRKLVMNPFLENQVIEIRDKVLDILNKKTIPECACGKCSTTPNT
jgi:CRISPR-associated protein Cas4